MPSGWADEFDKEDELITVPLLNRPCVMGITIWYDSDEEPLVNHVTKSGKVYQPAEKNMVKGKEVAIKESEPTAQVEEDLVLKHLRNALAHALDDTKISSNTTPKDMTTSLLLKPSSVVSFSNSDLPL